VAGIVALLRRRTAGARATVFAVTPFAFACIVPEALTRHPQARLAGGTA
jgi:hypothetical protein